MSTKIPKAWETIWAQEAIKAHRTGSEDAVIVGVDLANGPDKTVVMEVNPAGVSAEVLFSPARGPVKEFRESRVVPVGSDGFEHVEERYKAGCPGMVRDIFDEMTDQTERAGGAAPFLAVQVDTARAYRALHERVHSASMKCSKAFDPEVRGQGKVDFMDTYMQDKERLALFHEEIGDQVAKDTKRKVPAREGGVIIGEVQLRQVGRKIITVRALVDMVCIHERSLSEVLVAHGWRATGKNRKTLRHALRDALDRMRGV